MPQATVTSRARDRIRRIARGVPATQQGQSLAELSVVLPVLLLFLLGATNLGLALQAHMRLTQAVQQAVQLLSYNYSSESAGTYPDSTGTCGTSSTTFKSTTPYNTSSPHCFSFDVASYLYYHGFSDISNATITSTTSTDTVCQMVSGSTAVTSQVTVIHVSVDYPYTLVIPAFGGFNLGALQNGKVHLGATASTVEVSTTGPTITSTGGSSCP
jgi:hypothetical protein